ncbi:MAG: flagellar FliJ family protein [Phycisphaerales bacterium]|jgi:flagellar FliJ protein|nr:flagellar FliJ family protein [Phycisphaerales bacterium]
MAKFQFKLEPVLKQRKRVERDHQLIVAEIERERVTLEERIRMCQTMMTDERQTLSNALAGGSRVDLQAVKMQAGASLKHHFEAQRTVLELAGVYKKLESARQELTQAAMQRKAVELLRDQQLEEHKKLEAVKEARDLDELSVMRFSRNSKESVEISNR